MALIKAFITHKRSEKFADCQDSYSISLEHSSISVADGMTQSMLPKVWADLLTKEFTEDITFTLSDMDKVNALRDKWKLYFKNELDRQVRENVPTAWIMENHYNDNRSAGATFVGTRFLEDKVEYEILGDSCVVLVNNGRIVNVISSKQVGDEFDNYPDYIDSSKQIGEKGFVNKGEFPFRKGDEIIIVTDALSDILNTAFKDADKGVGIIKQLDAISDNNNFVELVEKLRDEGMTNDDTTMVHIKWSENKSLCLTDACYNTVDGKLENISTDETAEEEGQVEAENDSNNASTVEPIKILITPPNVLSNAINCIAQLFSSKKDSTVNSESNIDDYIKKIIKDNMADIVQSVKNQLLNDDKLK